ncbi:MAG: 2-oxo-4-hydroxy-4-carboxy-5-ureidoimidazoline decarboxylase [Ktedonobacterales bacterium]
MSTHPLHVHDLNRLDQEDFVAALAPAIEGPPWAIELLWTRRPFADVAHLRDALRRVILEAPRERQVALLRAHPDLVGRAALAGTLSSASAGEQAAAGLDQLTSEEIAEFQRLNAQYWARFNFPFVICARENKKEAILAGFRTRLGHNRDEEIALALEEVAKICALRLHALVTDDAPQS